MVLGHAYINVRYRLKDKKYRYESSEMRIVHSLTQIDYCRYKCNLVNEWLGKNATVRIIRNGPNGKYKAAAFSISDPYFKQLKRWCYPDGKKSFTNNMLDMLTPHGLAFWYMDDGGFRKNVNKDGWVTSVSTELSTYCPKDEAELIADWFDKTYALKWNVRCRKGSPVDAAFYLQTNTEGSKEFVALIEHFVIPSMRYKLAHVAAMNTHERQTPIGECECGTLLYNRRCGDLCGKCYMRKRRSAMI